MTDSNKSYIDYLQSDEYREFRRRTISLMKKEIDFRFRAGDPVKFEEFNIPTDRILKDGFYYSLTKNLLDRLEERGLEVERIVESSVDSNYMLARISGSISYDYEKSKTIIMGMLDRSFVGSVGAKIRNHSLSGAFINPLQVNHRTLEDNARYVEDNLRLMEVEVAPRMLKHEDGRVDLLSLDIVNSSSVRKE